MDYKLTDFLPTTKKECELRGWDELDVILFSGDAYVDHPSLVLLYLAEFLKLMAIVWLLCLNQTGMVISVISKSSDVHVCSLAFLQEPWTRW